MEEVKDIKFQPKTNDCIVCGAKFVYERQTMKYCSNACKCKAYQTRQTKNKLTKRINGTPGISTARSKQKIVPAQTTFQQITEQQYIDYIKDLQYMLIRAEQREKTREQRYEELTISRQEKFDAIRKVYEEQITKLLDEVKELRKMNKMWEVADKVLGVYKK
jgi:predicted nucleic acid-binding Zn ribbon protein